MSFVDVDVPRVVGDGLFVPRVANNNGETEPTFSTMGLLVGPGSTDETISVVITAGGPGHADQLLDHSYDVFTPSLFGLELGSDSVLRASASLTDDAFAKEWPLDIGHELPAQHPVGGLDLSLTEITLGSFGQFFEREREHARRNALLFAGGIVAYGHEVYAARRAQGNKAEKPLANTYHDIGAIVAASKPGFLSVAYVGVLGPTGQKIQVIDKNGNPIKDEIHQEALDISKGRIWQKGDGRPKRLVRLGSRNISYVPINGIPREI